MKCLMQTVFAAFDAELRLIILKSYLSNKYLFHDEYRIIDVKLYFIKV